MNTTRIVTAALTLMLLVGPVWPLAAAQTKSKSKAQPKPPAKAADFETPSKPFPSPDEDAEVTGLLNEQKYAEAAAAIARLMAEREPTLHLFIWRDIALNGQGKHAEADTAKAELLTHWNRHYRRAWLERGQSKGESSWPRLEPRGDGWIVQACEYFVPELVGPADGPHITNYYKFIVLDADGQPTGVLYKLEMSDLGQPFHVLARADDEGRRQVKRYGAKKPDMWTVLKDVTADVESSNAKDGAEDAPDAETEPEVDADAETPKETDGEGDTDE